MRINDERFIEPLSLVEFQVTNKCNAHCFFCKDTLKTSEELSFDLFKKVLDEVNPIGVSFTGGEPLLCKELPQMIRYCYVKGYITQINTNGLLLDLLKVKELEDAGLGLWHFSKQFMDKRKARIYQGISEKQNKLMDENIQMCMGRDVDVYVQTTLTIVNLIDLFDIHEWLYKIGGQLHEIGIMMSSGRAKGNRFTVPLNLLNKVLTEFFENKKDIFVKVECLPLSPCIYPDIWKFEGKNKIIFSPCKEGRQRIHIHNNGDIIICDQSFPLSETPIGNAKTDSVWDVYYNNPIIKKWREKPQFCCDKFGKSCTNNCAGSSYDLKLGHTNFGWEAFE